MGMAVMRPCPSTYLWRSPIRAPTKSWGDLYDSEGDLLGNATWEGKTAKASLEFEITGTSAPYKLE
jgi:hypothetical protein